MKYLKTPLRYPGGKSRACEKMGPYFPDLRDYREFREPFLGGGSVAIYITKKYPGLNIWVNDLYEPLVNFWQQLQMFGTDLKDKLVDLKTAHNTPDLARELLGYRTSTSLDKGLEELVNWIQEMGPKPFEYHLPLEFVTPKTPKTWSERIM